MTLDRFDASVRGSVVFNNHYAGPENKEENRPLFGIAFCPLVARKGASDRVSSFHGRRGLW
jgi:hypothetical protein